MVPQIALDSVQHFRVVVDRQENRFAHEHDDTIRATVRATDGNAKSASWRSEPNGSPFHARLRRPHRDPSDDTHPIDRAAGVADEFDRLTALGAVRHDGAVAAEKGYGHLRARASAVLLLLHEQLAALGAHDDRVGRARVRADIRREIRLRASGSNDGSVSTSPRCAMP